MEGLKIVVQRRGSADIDELLKAAALLAERDCIALLGSETGKLVAAVGQSGLAKGVKAGSIIRAAAKLLGGGGGGRPELAQGGGPNAGKLDEALAAGKGAMRAGGVKPYPPSNFIELIAGQGGKHHPDSCENARTTESSWTWLRRGWPNVEKLDEALLGGKSEQDIANIEY